MQVLAENKISIFVAIMNKLSERCSGYTLPQEGMAKGIYPYHKCISSQQDTEVIMEGRKVLMFGSNSYLGLTNHPKVIEAAVEATKKYGTGCAGSRYLNGTLDMHKEFEQELAEFVGKDEAMIFSTGFQTNLGALSCITGREDYIICDELDHASIVDGRRLSFSKPMKYKHNDMACLEKILKRCEPEDSLKLIAVDGVFSMEGDLANLPDIVKFKDKYNCCVMVDEAHGLGVLGDHGRGVCNHFGLTDQVEIIMGTFSKSLAAIGGFIAADKEIINWLRHHARSYIFSASNTPAATAAAREALHIMKNEPERIERLWDLTDYALNNFRTLGFEIGKTSTPIIPLYIRDFDKTFIITKMLFDEGVFVNPVIPPACSPEDTLIRFSLMATHTKEQIDVATEKLVKCFKAVGKL